MKARRFSVLLGLILLLLCLFITGCDEKIEPEHEHTWDEGVETKAATCTVKGAKLFTCTECGETKTEEITALGHTEVDDPAVPATCATAGKTAGKHCSVCGVTTVAQEPVEKHGNSWDDGDVTREPTCAVKGVKTYTCTVCHATKTEDIAINPENHIHLQTVSTVPATCIATGTKAHKHCPDCGVNFDAADNTKEVQAADLVIAIDPNNHVGAVYEGFNYMEAICGGEKGYTGDTICLSCNGIKEQGTVIVLEHIWGEEGTVLKEPDCGNEGEMLLTCTREGCNGTTTVPIPVPENAQHSLTPVAAVEPTDCLHNGNIAYRHCSVCGKNFNAEGEDLTELENVILSDPNAHNLQKVDAVAATCKDDGNIAYFQCTICGRNFDGEETLNELFTDDITIPKGPHTWNNGIVQIPATCTTTGVTRFTCTTCGFWEDRETAIDNVKGHNFEAGNIHEYKAATCTEDGNQYYKYCSRCSKYYDENGTEFTFDADKGQWGWFLPASHSLTHVEAVAATETTFGMKAYYHCSVCGKDFADETATTEIENLIYLAIYSEDEYELIAASNDATCEIPATPAHFHGKTDGKDYVCDYVEHKFVEMTDADKKYASHTLGESPAGTDAHSGKQYYHCSVCGNDFYEGEGDSAGWNDRVEWDSLEHSWIDMWGKEAICALGWKDYYYCEICKVLAIDDEDGNKMIVAIPNESGEYNISGNMYLVINDGFILQPKRNHLIVDAFKAYKMDASEEIIVAYYCENCDTWFSGRDENGNYINPVNMEEYCECDEDSHCHVIARATKIVVSEEETIILYCCDNCGSWFSDIDCKNRVDIDDYSEYEQSEYHLIVDTIKIEELDITLYYCRGCDTWFSGIDEEGNYIDEVDIGDYEEYL